MIFTRVNVKTHNVLNVDKPIKMAANRLDEDPFDSVVFIEDRYEQYN